MIVQTFGGPSTIIPQNTFSASFSSTLNMGMADEMMTKGYHLIPITGIREDFLVDEVSGEIRMLGKQNRDYRKSKQPYTPLVRRGLLCASNDQSLIPEWFGDAPFAAAVVCGPSGIFVLDVDIDPEKGKDGEADLKYLKEKYGITFPEPTIQTPKGGYHIYMLAPEGWDQITPSPELPIDGRKTALDIRVGNAYVIAPGSVVPHPVEADKIARYGGELPPVSDLQPVPEDFLRLLKWKDGRYDSPHTPRTPLIPREDFDRFRQEDEERMAKLKAEQEAVEIPDGDLPAVPDSVYQRAKEHIQTGNRTGHSLTILENLCREIFFDYGLNDRQGIELLRDTWETCIKDPEVNPLFTVEKLRPYIDKYRYPEKDYGKKRGWFLQKQLDELNAEDYTDIQALSDERTQAANTNNPFPLDALSDCFQFEALIRGHVRETRDPAAFVAVPGLVAFSSLLCNCHLLELSVGWREPGGMWGVNIGPPSCGKSPGYGAAMRPYEDINKEIELEQRELKATCPPIKVRKPGRPKQGEDGFEEVPVRPNYQINYFTKEALIDNIYKNGRGVFACNDEFAALIKKISPGGVDDGSFDQLNTFWVGRSQKATTKTSASFDGKTEHYIPRSNFALCGNIQPDNLRNMKCAPVMWNNGHMCRYLVAFPVILPKPHDPIYRPMEQGVVDDYRSFVEFGYEHLYQCGDPNNPTIYHFTADALKRFFEFEQENDKRVAAESCARKKDFISKLPSHIARLSLNLHCMAWVSRLGRSPSSPWTPDTEISLETLESAIKIAEWAYREFCRLVEYMDGQKARGVAKSDSGYILQILDNGPITVTKLMDRNRFKKDPLRLKTVLEEMVDTGLIRTEKERSRNNKDKVTVFKI